uniref:UvrABC system protein A n=1 Tax=uncultured Sphingobacteriales bacterium HF0130_33B19 TaxID=710991 RepID=E0XTQ4_9SPHI|nr:excinuclease ATPase subunit [uncultured Sphingobacteriales bacterium HF0130_33B19]
MVSQKDVIAIYGARVHNLKNLDLEIPRNSLVVFTGKSGSGKSSLAFDTIHAEGQRRYLETFNAYARQFIADMQRPDVDKITGLSPVVAIEQKTTSRSPRSTVGTITEIYHYLRLLYARVGLAYSYKSGKKMVRFSDNQIMDLLFKDMAGSSIDILAPIIKSRKGHYAELFNALAKKGYLKVRVDGEIIEIIPSLKLDRYKTHDIEVVIDRLKVIEKNKARLLASLKLAMDDGGDVMMVIDSGDGSVRYFSRSLMCLDTGIAYKNPEPNSFSFNSPKGACPACNGLGKYRVVDKEKIIPNTHLSINNGAIAPIRNRKSEWLIHQLTLIGKKHNFSLSTPFCEISDLGVDAIMYGMQDSLKVNLEVAGISKTHKIDFEGIISFIEDQAKNSHIKSIEKWASKYMSELDCEDCRGSRLNIESSHFRVGEKTIYEVASMDISTLCSWVMSLKYLLNDNELIIAEQIINELNKRLQFIIDVGLSYLSLNRGAKTLSGGEAQRIRLATQIGTQLTNVLYILDEPSIGLHQRDNLKLISSLKRLRDIGNSVIVVEHDRDMIKHADFIVDLGPGAGVHGGEVVSKGDYMTICASNHITAAYLNGVRQIQVPKKRRQGNGKSLSIIGAKGNNLKNIDVSIPLGLFCCITGVSGSGKSTLINETIYPILNQHFFRGEKEPLAYKSVLGLDNIDKVIAVDQSPIGRTPRSNPATYTGVFSDIRALFSTLPESKIRGYKVGRFSFNVLGGRCEECKGGGKKTVEMNFLPDVEVHCDKCNGMRYNRETLEIRFKGKSISDVLNLTIDQAVDFFSKVPSIYQKIKTLQDVGLGYITLGHSATTLSGGEAQRIKLASQLSKRSTGNTFYILDEPTTGLHFEDVQVLLSVINTIVNQGNSVVVIEHNLDVIKVCDYIIDLGKEGGEEGGYILCNGTPEEIVKYNDSYTAGFLLEELNGIIN